MGNKDQTKAQGAQLQEVEASMSTRFMNKIMAEFGNNVGEVSLTNFQKVLAQNYFIAIDGALKMAEEKRLKKSEKYRDKVPVTWANVNMDVKFARNVIACARVGLDPAQPNHINVMPFKNNNLNKYDIVFVEGYRGKEIKAVKYGLDVPDDVTVELVYSNDVFKPIKKDRNNKIESYDFEVANPFNRGEIVGGFYYYSYSKVPEKNRLVIFTLKDILKRKPAYASVEFWGGEKDVWKNGQKTGEKEQVEGWYEKMCWKTVYRAAYNDITIDSQKIDDDYLRLKQLEESYAESEVAREIAENANKETIDVEFDVVDENTSEPETEPEEEAKEEPAAEKEPVTAGAGQQTIEGPGF
jgi:recombination protein RecT